LKSLDTSVEAARVGACATSAQGVFIGFGGSDCAQAVLVFWERLQTERKWTRNS
jgi:hypothetical protein